MEKAIAIIKHYEGLHDGDLTTIGLQPKMCPAGVWTIGYGHALTNAQGRFLKGEEDKEEAYALGGSITQAQAEELLKADYNRFELSVRSMLMRPVEDYELGAMSSLAYNIGLGCFKTSSVLFYFKQKQKAVAAESFKLWVKSNGKVLNGLQKRRLSERHLFLYNELKFF